MKTIFRNSGNVVRGGWKIAAFFLMTIALAAGLIFLRRSLPDGIQPFVPEPILIAVATLIASWICVRLEKASLISIGLRLDSKFVREFAVGVMGGLSLMGVTAIIIWLCDGFHLEMAAEPADIGSLLWKHTTILIGVAAFEEIIFRGYAFQRAIRSMGVTGAQLVFALIFALMHFANPGLSAATFALAMANIFLASLMLGYCYLRTGSLALPIGVHFAWNWLQTCLGFPSSGNPSKGIWHPVYHGHAAWLTGGDFGPEASIVSVLTLGLVVIALAKWKGAARQPSAVFAL